MKGLTNQMKTKSRILSTSIAGVLLAAALSTSGAFAYGGSNSDASGNEVMGHSSVTNTETSTHVDVHVGKISVQTSKIDGGSDNTGVLGSNNLTIGNTGGGVTVNSVSMATMSSNAFTTTKLDGTLLAGGSTMNTDSGNVKNIDSGNTTMKDVTSTSNTASGGSNAGNSSGCSTNGNSLGGGC